MSVEKKIKSLVIVESPAKAKTIEKLLGKDFYVTSSVGHIRDLPKKEMSIDIKKGFIPNYEISPEKKKTVSELKKLVKESETVWLATDEDREGEAIAWHLCEALGLDYKKTKRIVFHEITKTAISKAIQNPRIIDKNLVDAQQARRVLDRLVGYELSPVLWKKVKKGLSAGRVQSVAVRLIVEREREIEDFKSEASFRIIGEFLTEENKKFNAELKKRFKSLEEAEKFLNHIKNSTFTVSDLIVKPSKKSPSPPFTTSTLQQEASRKLGFSVKQTMIVAQKLYESGKITYMRTDSLNLSDDALNNAKDFISSEFGKNYSNLRKFKTKNESAQEAHEAIRPTDISASEIKGERDQSRLYELIWKRTVASQMADAELEKTTANIEISNSEELFVATGEVIKFDGFLKVYIESSDEDNGEENGSKMLPKIRQGENPEREKITGRQVFKNPPARYTEASLVKKLEELSIGRPSTYAPTISTIQDRGYVEKGDREGKIREYFTLELAENQVTITKKSETTGSERAKLFPTDMGLVVNDFLVKFFPVVVDFNFTAKVEEEFDEIAEGKIEWQSMIAGFYHPFHKTIESSDGISREEAVQSRELGTDPKSGRPIYVKIGPYGPMFQLGDKEDIEKPKFASLPKGMRMEQATISDALQYFALPRKVGLASDGSEITAQIGRFGPYVKLGSIFASISEDEIFTITPEEAEARVNAKKESSQGANIKEFPLNDNIKVKKGRFGPYVTDGKTNAKIPKGTEPASLTLEECLALIENSSSKKKTTRRAKA
ncbi:MAG: type I DNA topoisomerase [Candidatus Kapabacteria bacterium]|nr:type I DNA topoisomerase [Ignavibacteriota bacterium]MCW5884715.1 type I DNA topoisomerase [Candidatus Kapabacteria bacterium]